MKYYIFRNQTIEPFFKGEDFEFSGYDDISIVPESDGYIWFYQVPPGDSFFAAHEVDSYITKLTMVLNRIDADKPFIVFTLAPLANTLIVGGKMSLQLAMSHFNTQVAELAAKHNHVKIVDFSEFTCQYPKEQLVNWKFYFISQTLFNPKLAKDFQSWWQHKENELALKRKKCLILDLDNTLWGGILGEDGIAGIRIGGDYPGKAFSYWQHALLELKKSGVMLAVCSKNNEADVLEAWEKNPFMVLHKDDFVAWRINWQDKATNIRELAQVLNIGLDSMVFVDDNPTERELIRQMLPMVETPEFPEKPYQLMAFYDEVVKRYFRVYSITSEDKSKTEQYRANAQRAAEQAKFADYNEYLRSLEIEIDIISLDQFNLSRIAQMTQKTNQFNLTTRRYTENDILRITHEGGLVYAISVRDKFGDNGITGEIIMRPIDASTMEIDTLLLSCRILGKGIEFAFLDTILNMLADKRIETIIANYIKTAKNAQVADFYDRAGFTLQDEHRDEKSYLLRLTAPRSIKNYYTITIK